MNRHELAAMWAPTLDLAAAAPIDMEERRRMGTSGVAMPDGSFPIPDVSHLESAIRLARTPEQRSHVMKRAKALGKSNMIPDAWTKSAALRDEAMQQLVALVTDMGTALERLRAV
jgi:hypothetical protein